MFSHVVSGVSFEGKAKLWGHIRILCKSCYCNLASEKCIVMVSPPCDFEICLMVGSFLKQTRSAWGETSWNWILPHLRIKNDLKLARFFPETPKPKPLSPGAWNLPLATKSMSSSVTYSRNFYTLWRCKTVKVSMLDNFVGRYRKGN